MSGLIPTWLASCEGTLAAASALGAALPVAAYLAYTLAEWTWLRPLVQAPGRWALLAASLAGVGGAAWLARSPALLLWAALPLAAVGWASWRQWLLPRREATLHPTSHRPVGDPLVAVLADDSAVPLPWLAALRTARVGDVVLVHCGLSGALAAFAAPGRLAAVLPHPTGFWLGLWTPRYDGLDGQPVARGPAALTAAPLRLCRLSVWQRACPAGRLLGPPRPRPARAVRALTASARRHGADRSLGQVQDQRWRELAAETLAECGPADQPRRYLSRWAAAARGLEVQEQGPTSDTHRR